MTNRSWKQLNLPKTSTYIEFPIAFTGKQLKNGAASVFAGLPLSCQFILAIVHTFNKMYGEPAKLTYEFFVQRFSMSKETVSKGIFTLTKLEIIEKVKQSHYIIKPRYNKKDYLEIDEYLFKHKFIVNGSEKRLSYSRRLEIGLIKRGCSNPKTGGVFVSSQARIGTALNLPRTTAGDGVREIKAAGVIQTEKPDGNDKRRRGCSLYIINPEVLEVKHPNPKTIEPQPQPKKAEPSFKPGKKKKISALEMCLLDDADDEDIFQPPKYKQN